MAGATQRPAPGAPWAEAVARRGAAGRARAREELRRRAGPRGRAAAPAAAPGAEGRRVAACPAAAARPAPADPGRGRADRAGAGAPTDRAGSAAAEELPGRVETPAACRATVATA